MRRTIRTIRLFKKWPEEQLQELYADTRVIRAAVGEAVIRQGQVLEGLYAIVAGCLELGSDQPDGRRYIRRYAEPGLIFGFLSVFDGKGSPYFYIAHEPTQILFVPRSAFLSVLGRHSGLWLSVMREVAAYQRNLYAAIEEGIFESLRVRLARMLVSLAEAYGTAERSGTAIHIKLTQDSLGSLLGVTRQSVSKELKRFEHEGLVKIDYGRITLADPTALERAAQEHAGRGHAPI